MCKYWCKRIYNWFLHCVPFAVKCDIRYPSSCLCMFQKMYDATSMSGCTKVHSIHPLIWLLCVCVCWVYSLIVVIWCCWRCWRLQLLFVSSKNRFICSAWLYPDSCLVDRFLLFLSRFLSDCMCWLTTDTIENVWESSTIFVASCYETQYYNSYIILVGFLLTASYGPIHTFLSWCTLGKMQKIKYEPVPPFALLQPPPLPPSWLSTLPLSQPPP